MARRFDAVNTKHRDGLEFVQAIDGGNRNT